jgi:hypothetical protein
MAVIRLRADRSCHRCGSSIDLPHTDHHECLAAIGREVLSLLDRTRELTARRRQLVEQRVMEIEERRARMAQKLKTVRRKRKR